MLTDLDATGEEIRAVRLELEKKITTEKDRRKSELLAEAMDRLECAPRLRQSVYGRSVAEALKGKRTIDSMRKALDIVVTCHNATISKSRGQIESFTAAHGEAMVPDREELETRQPDAVEIELRRRFEAKKAEDARKRLEEEAAKARAEAEAARRETEAVKNPDPPVGPIAAAPAAEALELTAQPSDREEWIAFEGKVRAALRELKPIRESLIHQKNISRAQVFANALNQAWQNR